MLDRQELQNALLDLLQAVVVGVQHLAGRLHVDPLLGVLAPGQLQHGIQVIAQNGGLGGAEGLLLQPVHLFRELVRHLLGQLGLGDALAVLGNLAVAAGTLLPQLLLKNLELLPQNIVPLAAGELLPHLALHLLFQLQNLHLPAEALAQALQAAHRPQLLQNGLLVPRAHGQVLSNVVGDVARVLTGEHREEHIGSHLGGQLNKPLKQLVGLANEGLRSCGTADRLFRRKLLHQGVQVGRGLGQKAQPPAADPLHHHPHVVSGQAQNLAHIADGPNAVKVLFLRAFNGQLPLGHQENRLA